ncbi:MAG TPA: PAS domain-containing protein [Candidatus Acidoferrum sp.]|nr:PAS domain-containing protein [Candidatus Acidoferrum sp.]
MTNVQTPPADILARLIDCSTEMLSILDTGFRYLAVNRPHAMLFGREPADFPGMTVEQTFAHEPEHYRNVILPMLEDVRAGKEGLFEQWVLIPGRGRSFIEVRYLPLRNAAGEVDAIVTVSRDRTEIMLTIEALQQSEKMLKRTQHIARLGGWTFDATSGTTQWTDEMYEIHEVGRDFVPTQENLASFITPEEVTRVRADLALAMAGKETSLISHMTSAKGRHKWVRSMAFPAVKDGQVTGLDGMLQDVTDIVEMQTDKDRALRSLENQKYVLDQHAIVTVTGIDGRIMHANRLFTDLSGYDRDELVGLPNTVLRSGMHPPEFFREMWDTITAGRVWQGEICNRAKDGGHFWMHTTIVPLYDESGIISEYVSVSANITKLKQTEATLRRAQKMEAIGQLSGGIAHDFNNLLGIVIGNIELAELQMPVDDPVRKTLENARNAAVRGTVLTRRLLNFSRQAPVAGALLNINQVLSGLEVLISKSLTALIMVELKLDPDIGLVQMHAGDLEDALINLTINAGDAMPDGGRLQFVTRNRVVTDVEYLHNIALRPGAYVELSVIDSGSGIDRDTLEKIFEPYFTTKSGNKGTGLGLAMVYGFVQRSQGYITVESEPGRGSCFTLYLPVAGRQQSAEVPGRRSDRQALAKGSETILLVDDEEAIVMVTTRHLQNLGYRVLAFTSADAAIEQLQRDEPIDLLFTDVVMPGGINGVELAERALQLQPGIKILLTTGYARIKDQRTMDRWQHNLIAKPYSSADLSRKLRELLDN